MCIVCQGVAIAVSVVTPLIPGHLSEQPTNVNRVGAAVETVSRPAVVETVYHPAADLAGTTCRTSGTIRKVGKNTYRCTSSNAGLRWRPLSKVSKSIATTPRPAAGHFAATCDTTGKPCPITSAATYDISACKVADMTYQATDGGAQGFPRPPRAKAGKATLNILVLPIRYQGMNIAESTVRQRFDLEFKQSQEFMTRN